jgi:hypothetical protein
MDEAEASGGRAVRGGRRSVGAAVESGTGASGTGASEGAGSRLVGWPVWLVALAPFAVAVVAVLVGVGGDFHPLADVAQTELLTRDVGHHPVQLGPFSRDGWHHPGPALFFVLALPYRLLGSSSGALSAGAVLVGGGSVAGMAAVARRRGGTPLLLCLLVTLLLFVRAARFVDVLAMPWNPYITVLPYGLLVLLVWAMACGDRWALPAGALVATFLVQTHVGYVALAVPLLGLGALALVASTVAEARARPATSPDASGAAAVPGPDAAPARPPTPAGAEGTDRPVPARGVLRWWPWRSPGGRLGGAAGLTLVAIVVTWSLPVWQQVNNEPGNIGVIVRWFRAGGHETHPLSDGWRIVAGQFALWPEWIAGQWDLTIVQQPTYLIDPVAPVLLVPFVLALVAAWRHPGGAARRFAGVLVVAWVLGALSVARTVGIVYAYRLLWAWVLGAIAGAFTLWVGWTWLARRVPAIERRVLVPAALAGLVVLAGVDAWAAAVDGPPDRDTSAMVGELVPQVTEALSADDEPVVIEARSFSAIGWGAALVLELEHQGIDVRVPDRQPSFGEHRLSLGEARRQLEVLTDGDIPRALDLPGAELIAYTGRLSVDQVRAATAEQAELAGRLESGELTEIQAMVEAEQLLPTGSAVAVVAPPP